MRPRRRVRARNCTSGVHNRLATRVYCENRRKRRPRQGKITPSYDVASGESIGFYYLRARYMNPGNGRFTQTDPYEGAPLDPISLHKYAYANAEPVVNRDPSGLVTLGEIRAGIQAGWNLALRSTATFGNLSAQAGARVATQLFVQTIRVAAQLRPYISSMPRIGTQIGRVMTRLFGHFKRFTQSKAFRKAGKHEIELWGPSPAVDTKEVHGPKIPVVPGSLYIDPVSGGGAGRIFQFVYKIGRNPPGGLFRFRYDYLDYRSKPAVFNPHVHISYLGVSVNHGIP